ncbi:MAG: shikimate kinase [Dehalococcoidia bacterium]
MKSNIALIGFMGAGKSSVGRALAGNLNMEFVELDALVTEKYKKSIAEIFQQEGEPAFRRIEAEVALEAAKKSGAVIACGGGIVINPANIDALKETCRIVYLKVLASVALERVAWGGEKRPLLEVPDPAAAARELLQFRKPLYEKATDFVIDTTDLSVQDVVDQIAAWWAKQ